MAEKWVSTDLGKHLRGRKKKNTAPEVLLRQALHRAGYRFRLGRSLGPVCNPDLVLPRHKIAVWVDGDYWHCCPRHGRTQFTGPNATLWEAKMARNRRRDAEAVRLASSQGWIALRIWECEIHEDPDRQVERIRAAASRQASWVGPAA